MKIQPQELDAALEEGIRERIALRYRAIEKLEQQEQELLTKKRDLHFEIQKMKDFLEER